MEKVYDTEDELEIDLREVFFALWQRLWMIILALALGGGLAILYSKVILTPQYTSTTMVYILSKETTLTSLADLQIGSQLTKDYKVLVTSRPVLQEVIDSLVLNMEYEELKERVNLENPADTRMLSISIEDPDPVKAKAIVDAIAKVSSKYIGDIMEMTPPKIIEDGVIATNQSSPHVGRNAVIGGVLAALAVIGMIVLQVILNDTIQTEEDVEKYLQLSVLAAVPEREENRVTAETGSKKKKKKNVKKKGTSRGRK